MQRVVLMVGPSGSGKSTYVGERFPGFLLLNADRLRREIAGDESDQTHNAEVFALLRKRLADALRNGRSVVVDNTNVRKSSRDELYRITTAFGVRVEARVMSTPLDECLARNANRERKVPDDVIRRQFAEHLATLERLPRERALSLVEIVSD